MNNKSKRGRRMAARLRFRSVALLLAGVTSVSAAYAAEVVKVNGKTYRCQNRCQIATRPGGGFSIWDSGGGWVMRIALNGEGIIEDRRK
ncbi:hypothetical protein [Stenotrophomonas sp. YIM B13575]|uniref:hypothetical protein n=1 Tax=Stenotrophomonas sp. YIM B13575 TaxID=3366314 RepID=UPI0036B1C207